MPAIRRPRHDVILRVPRAIFIPDSKPQQDDVKRRGSGRDTAQIEHADGRTAQTAVSLDGQQSIYRRSASPVKGRSALDDLKALDDSNSHIAHGSGSVGPSDTRHARKSTYAYATQATSAAEWNSLLIWARRQRGPQWDSATGMWQVDQHSTEYYSFGNDPARHTKLSTAAKHSTKGVTDPAGSANSNNDRNGSIDSVEPTGANERSALESHDTLDSQHQRHTGGGTNAGADLSGEGRLSSMHPSGVFAAASEDSPPPVGAGMRRSRAR